MAVVASFPRGGAYTVTYDADGRAQLAFDATGYDMGNRLVAGALSNYATAQVDEQDEAVYLGRSLGSSAITEYKKILPVAAGRSLTLKIDYTMLSTDGSAQEIHIKGATATVPAEYAAWKSGYAYTYIFKISDDGLFPITFDAWSASGDSDGQGTVTTLGDYSITTWQDGDVDGNEMAYRAAEPIEVTVIKGDGSEQEKVVLGDQSPRRDWVRIIRQSSNDESEVEMGYTAEQTISYANGTASFTPPMAGYYRVEYWHNATVGDDTTKQKLAVKIVKVGTADANAASILTSNEYDNDYRHAKPNGACMTDNE